MTKLFRDTTNEIILKNAENKCLPFNTLTLYIRYEATLGTFCSKLYSFIFFDQIYTHCPNRAVSYYELI